MATPTYFGSVSVPTSGAIASASTTAAPFASAIQTGPNPYGSVSVGDVNATRNASGGVLILGGTTERGVLDFGVTNTHALTIQGIGGSATSNVVVQGTIQGARSGFSVGAYVPPGYFRSGATVPSTLHIVADNITASAATTTVNLLGASAFTSSANYVVVVEDQTAPGVFVALTAKTLNSFTFNSTNGHLYTFTAIGW